MDWTAEVRDRLLSLGFKQKGKQLRGNSPFRPGSDSESFVVDISPMGGAWYDHVAGTGGSLFELAKHFGVDTGGRTEVASTKRAYAGLADYARAHGLPEGILRQAGWIEVQIEARPALELVTSTGKRWRFLDGKKPTFKSTPGYKKCWYGLRSRRVVERLSRGEPLLICNGEISVVTADYYGLAACAVTAGEGTIPDPLLDELLAVLAEYPETEVIVTLDCDEKGRKAAESVVKQLTAASVNARAVDLQLSDKGDLADFCMLYTDEAADRIKTLPALSLDQPTTIQQQRSWYILHASKLADLPRIGWTVQGIIPEIGIVVLFGPSGAGKSFLAVHYALIIAQKFGVVYIVYEGDAGYYQRLLAWMAHHNSDPGQLYFVMGGGVPFMAQGEVEAFIEQCRPLSPRFVVIDTAARSMVGSDENSTRDMGLFIAACEHVKRELGCAVLIVHHTNKAGVSERGSGALRGAADVMIKQYMDDDVVIIECSKTKDAEPFPTAYMKLLPVQIALDGAEKSVPVLVPTDKIVESPDSPLTRNQIKVMEALSLEIFSSGATVVELAETIPDMERGAINRAISRLMAKGYVMQPAKREPYELTKLGLTRLTQLMTHSTLAGSSLNDSDDSHDSVDSRHFTNGAAPNQQSVIRGESIESIESLRTTEGRIAENAVSQTHVSNESIESLQPKLLHVPGKHGRNQYEEGL